MKGLRNFVDHHPLSAFLLLAFGIAWILWIPGTLVSHGRTVSFGIFGIYSLALAGMIVSHRGKRVEQAVKVRLVVFAAALLIAVASMLSASFFLQHTPLSSQALVFAFLVSSIAAWIVSGADSRDAGTREYLSTLDAAFNTLPDFLPSAPGMTWLLWGWAGAVIVTDRMWFSNVKRFAAKSLASRLTVGKDREMSRTKAIS